MDIKMAFNKHVCAFLESIVVRNDKGEVKVKDTQAAFKAAVEAWQEQQATAHAPVRDAMVAVLARHTRLTRPLLVAKVHAALGGADDTFSDVNTQVGEILKSDPGFVSTRGRDGGVSLAKVSSDVVEEAPAAE